LSGDRGRTGWGLELSIPAQDGSAVCFISVVVGTVSSSRGDKQTIARSHGHGSPFRLPRSAQPQLFGPHPQSAPRLWPWLFGEGSAAPPPTPAVYSSPKRGHPPVGSACLRLTTTGINQSAEYNLNFFLLLSKNICYFGQVLHASARREIGWVESAGVCID